MGGVKQTRCAHYHGCAFAPSPSLPVPSPKVSSHLYIVRAADSLLRWLDRYNIASALKVLTMNYIGVLIFQFILFGLIGMRAFGGLLYRGNPALVGSEYDLKEYYPNN